MTCIVLLLPSLTVLREDVRPRSMENIDAAAATSSLHSGTLLRNRSGLLGVGLNVERSEDEVEAIAQHRQGWQYNVVNEAYEAILQVRNAR